MRKFLSLLSVPFVLSGCVSPQDPTNIRFPDDTPQALLLIKIDPAPTGFELQIAPFRQPSGTIDQHIFNARHFSVPKLDTPQYLALTVKPDTYAVTSLWQQDIWGLCFHQQAKVFTVRPGDAVFLGEFDPTINLLQLTQKVIAAGQTSVRTLNYRAEQKFLYTDGILPVQITSPADGSPDFTDAKKYEAEAMPMLHGRLKAVSYSPGQFRIEAPGSLLPSCGYYVE